MIIFDYQLYRAILFVQHLIPLTTNLDKNKLLLIILELAIAGDK